MSNVTKIKLGPAHKPTPITSAMRKAIRGIWHPSRMAARHPTKMNGHSAEVNRMIRPIESLVLTSCLCRDEVNPQEASIKMMYYLVGNEGSCQLMRKYCSGDDMWQ